MEPIVNNGKCVQVGCRVKLISYRPAYFSDEVLAATMVLHYDLQTRADSGTFYPQRTIRFLRAATGGLGSPDWQSYDYYICLQEQDGSLLAEDVLHHSGDEVEIQLIRH